MQIIWGARVYNDIADTGDPGGGEKECLWVD